MSLEITYVILKDIHAHCEDSYPDEGAGLLLGELIEGRRYVRQIMPAKNQREDSARHNRYLISPEDLMRAELEADNRGLDLIGIYHSHPEHPPIPSEFDREWALPNLSYLIMSVVDRKVSESQSWRLSADRNRFEEELVILI